MRTLKPNTLYSGFTLHLIIAGLILLCRTVSFSQSAVVSSYFNGNAPADEWTEILVIQDDLDMRNWTLRDNNQNQNSWQSPITLNSNFWNHMRAGTVIIIWHRQKDAANVNHPVDVNKADGYIEVNAQDPAYFTGGNFTPVPGTTLNIASGDIVQLRNSTNVHIHALGHKLTVGADFTALPSPKLCLQLDLNVNEANIVCPGATILDYGTNTPQIGTTFTAVDATTPYSKGLPNSCSASSTANSDFWRLTRQPLWPIHTATAVPLAGNTQVKLDWSAATDPYFPDGTQGYLILRNSVNTFQAPQDGHTYAVNDVIGTATVVNKITSSSTLTWTDTYNTSCGTSVYYRIYAYRYSIDNSNTNDLNAARGTAYNETDFAEAQVLSPSPPTAYAVSGNAGYCDGSSGETVTVINSETGTNYDLFMDCGSGLVHVQGPIGGSTGTPIAFLPQTVTLPGPCTLKVVGSLAVNAACTTDMLNTLSVSVFSPPALSITAHNPSTCLATDGYLELFNLLPNTNYILSYTNNGSVVTPYTITTDATGHYTLSGLTAGTYTNIFVTSTDGCDSNILSQSLSDPSQFTPSISISSNVTATCAGSMVTFTSAITGGGATPAYAWFKNGISTGITTSTYSDNTLSSSDIISCTLTSSDNCASPANVSSNQISIAITASVTPAILVSMDNDTICPGTMVTFTAIPTNGGATPSYTWKKNGTTVGSGTTYLDNTLVSSDQISCSMVSNDPCASPTNVQSTPVSVFVTSSVTPAITISADNTSVCAGTMVNFTASPSNGGSSPSYQWTKNGSPVGTGPAYSDNTLVSSDVIQCTLTSSEPCASTPTATSNTISISIVSNLIPAVSITADNATICTGMTVIFTANPVNGGTNPGYQWKLNGSNTGSNSFTFSSSSLNNGDVVECILTSNDACASPTTATSNTVTISVVSALIPAISISADQNPVCAGTAITFTASPINQGSAPVYQWSLNGNPVGSNNSSYSLVNPADADHVVCNLQSNAQCASPTLVSSLPVDITVYSPPTINQIDTTGTINGAPNGSATVQATGTSLQYSLDGLSWQSSNSFTGLTAKVYTCYVKDGNGCTNSMSFEIMDQLITSMFLEAGTAAACPGHDLSLDIHAKGLSGFTSFNICISFNPGLVHLTGILSANALLPGLSIDSIAPGNAMIQFTSTSTISIPDNDLLFTLGFKAISEGAAGISWLNFLPGVCGIYDNTGSPMLPAFTPGLATVYTLNTASYNGITEVCEGEPITLTALGTGLTHEWTAPDGSILPGDVLSFSQAATSDAGLYLLTAVNSFGCSDQDSIDLIIHTIPQFTLSQTDPLCAEGTYTLSPGNSYAFYNWSNGLSDPSITATGEGIFWVEVTDDNGCKASDSVELVTCPAAIYVPSAFSPNQDSRNDIFHVTYTAPEGLEGFKMIIYDRWGQLLFESNTVEQGWDGTYKGSPCPSGVYSYIILFKKPEGKAFSQDSPYKGMVTLVR